MVAVGSWAVSSKGDVHFSLAVPDEATWVSTARVAVIAQSDTVMTYDVTMAHSSGGLSQDAYTDGQAAVGPIVLVAGQVHEIDVSSVLPTELVPGRNYLALHLTTSPKNAVWVIGLRFGYEILEGDQGPAGPAGPAGGPQGEEGPAGAAGDPVAGSGTTPTPEPSSTGPPVFIRTGERAQR